MRFHRQLLSVFAVVAVLASGAIASDSPKKNTGKVVLGRVGKVLKDTSVYTQPNQSSTAYFSAKTDQYLVVKTEAPEGWAKILLNTGKYGFIPADAIQPLKYEVTTEAKPRHTSTYVASRGSSSARAAAAEKGLDFVGTPYRWGGNDITGGIDCSGFVQQLYGAIGLSLPRTAAEQALVGKSITRLEDLQKGDRLYFWDSRRAKIGHTGLYLGGGKFVHSSSSHGGVNVDDLRSGHWLKILVAARR